MSLSMQHFNGNQLCAMDTETTGFTAGYHEICQFACIPLDANLKPRTDVMPFSVHFRLEHPDRAEPEAMKVNKLTVAWLQINGFDKYKVIDMFEEWVNKLKLPYTASCRRKQIVPLGQNFSFDMAFIKEWMGDASYRDLFHYHYRDTLHAAAYLNDRAAMHGEKVPFSKLNLNWLANKLDVETNKLHDALEDSRVTAEVYRRLMMTGLLG